jgi:hypothetical protein
VCEEKESMELARLGVFWEDDGGGEFAIGKEKVVENADREAEKEKAEWEKEVVDALESLKTVHVADGWVLSSSSEVDGTLTFCSFFTWVDLRRTTRSIFPSYILY